MMNMTENNFKSELRSFFGLIMLNLVTAAMAIGLGVALVVTILMERVQAGDIFVPSLLLIPLGAIALVCGIIWGCSIEEGLQGTIKILLIITGAQSKYLMDSRGARVGGPSPSNENLDAVQ